MPHSLRRHLDYSAPEPMMGVADDDFYYPRELEASFCRDFSCCGLILNDLHDLLQHYEECHVRFEDDDAQADLSDGCFFDDEWSSEDCLTGQEQTQAPSASDLTSYGLSLEHHLLLSAATSTSTAVSTAVPSPTLSCKDASTVTGKVAVSTPPLSPTTTATSSVINSPLEAALHYPADGVSAGGRKRSAAGAAEQAHAKKHATASASAAAAARAAVDLAFPSSVLGLYDDDIIAAIASATDPLFLSSAAAAAAGSNGQETSLHHSSALAHVANAAVAVVSGDYEEDSDEDSIHLPPSVTAAMAGAVAAAAAAKAHGLLPRDDKPYRCPITGCDKAYKNPNGLKYHNLHGHCNMGEDLRASSKPYKCRVPECYKAYKNLNGLKYHVQHAHCAMIPSIRDLPANATPAEVAAAVAQAAAHAAAQAVAASAPVSPMPSPSPSAASSPMPTSAPINRAPVRAPLPPSSSPMVPGSGIRLQPPPLRTGPGAIRSAMGPQQHRPLTNPQQRIGGGPAPSGMPPRPLSSGQAMMANRRPAPLTPQSQQQQYAGPRPRPLTSSSPASAGQTPVNGSMPIRRPAPPAATAAAPAPVATTAPRQPVLQATASC
ncbi:Transcriptional regulator of ribosomal biogenesis proteins [Coemansia sp. RSA 2675]|nr:Transcriptional regulator of ribosomal biogenesis proteins [Coemansia sp. RSA 2675]